MGVASGELLCWVQNPGQVVYYFRQVVGVAAVGKENRVIAANWQ